MNMNRLSKQRWCNKLIIFIPTSSLFSENSISLEGPRGTLDSEESILECDKGGVNNLEFVEGTVKGEDKRGKGTGEISKWVFGYLHLLSGDWEVVSMVTRNFSAFTS